MAKAPIDTPQPPAVFDTRDAADLLVKQTGLVNALWGIYAAISFTAVGFAISQADSAARGSWLITILAVGGFSIFLYGHWAMVRAAVKIMESLRAEIAAALDRDASSVTIDYQGSIRTLITQSYDVKNSRRVHVSIDICSIAILILAPRI